MGMSDELRDILRIERVEDRVEVCPIGEPISRIGVLHVFHDLLVQDELRVDLIHAKLVKLRHVDEPTLAHLEQLLLPAEHLPKEVSIAAGQGRQIVLHYECKMIQAQVKLTMVTHVGYQVLLRTELVC